MPTPARPSNALRALAAVLLLALAGCSTVYYSVWETLGKEKRDLLRDNVEAVREDQEDVQEEFESALERVKALYGLDGGDLEKHYDKLSSAYEDSEEEAQELRDRIRTVEEIAADLFAEWESELGEISDANLRSRSRQQLQQTRGRYRQLESSMHAAERRMDPVLQKLKDQVLFLKHNLNAQAVGSLGGEADAIERDIERLITDLQASIREADAFIEQLPE